MAPISNFTVLIAKVVGWFKGCSRLPKRHCLISKGRNAKEVIGDGIVVFSTSLKKEIEQEGIVTLNIISLGRGYLRASAGKPRMPIRKTQSFVKVGVKYSWEEYLAISHLDLLFPPKYEYIDAE